MRRLVILRPEPGSSESLERARALGLDAVALPLFRIEPLEWAAPDVRGFDALLLTSANAVRCAGGRTPRLPVYAVGAATAAAARQAGLEIAVAGDSNLQALLREIPKELRLLHLCGEHRTDAGGSGHSIMAVPVYRARAVEVEDAAGAVRGQVAAVHSPRAGARLAELIGSENRRSVRVAAISEAAATAAGGGWERVEAAGAPSDPALLALAARLCEEDGR